MQKNRTTTEREEEYYVLQCHFYFLFAVEQRIWSAGKRKRRCDDYFTDSASIPTSFIGTEVLEDGYFRLTEENIENHFKDRFELCKKLFEQASLSDFCEGIKDGIMPVELIIDETYKTYIVCDYNPDDLSECCSMTLDSFLRKAYQEIRSNEEKIRYIVGCCGYHC